MEYVLSKFKIKTGQLEAARAFLQNLHKNHQRQMAEVLTEAGMTLDCSFIDCDHLYIFKRIENHQLLNEKMSQSKLPIYDEIRKWADQIIESSDQISCVAAFDIIQE
jgi:hypothetical protein